MAKKKKQLLLLDALPFLEVTEIGTLSLEDRVKRIEDVVGRRFNSKTIVKEALTVPGASCSPKSRPDAHKDLAQVGDAVLNLALTMEGYRRGHDRATINRMISNKGSNVHLGEVCSKYGFDRLLYTDPSQLGSVSYRTRATAVEAILGAVYLDSSLDISAAISVMEALRLTWPSGGTLREQQQPPQQKSQQQQQQKKKKKKQENKQHQQQQQKKREKKEKKEKTQKQQQQQQQKKTKA